MSLVRFFLACLFVFATPALAQPQHANGTGHWKQTLIDNLSLSEQQRELLAKCDEPQSGRRLAIELQEERLRLNTMLRDKEVPENDIRAQIQRLNEKQAAWNSQRLEKFLQIRRVLTAEQIKQLQDLREDLGSKPNWGGHGHGLRGNQ